MRSRTITAAVIGSVLWACSSAPTHAGGQPTPEPVAEVVISDYKFVPLTLTVAVGTTVTWVNHDMARHTATRHSSDEPFDSGLLGNQQIFTHTFRTAGSYRYICTPHSGMQATIVVR